MPDQSRLLFIKTIGEFTGIHEGFEHPRKAPIVLRNDKDKLLSLRHHFLERSERGTPLSEHIRCNEIRWQVRKRKNLCSRAFFGKAFAVIRSQLEAIAVGPVGTGNYRDHEPF